MTRHLKKHALATEDARDDPLGDGTSAAPSRFVWGKKIEKKIRDGADVASLTAAAHATRAAERLDEIETIKRRREAREAEREAREAEAAAAAREKAVAEGADLEAKEEAFHLDQAKRRAAARVAGGRAGLADVLAKELHLLVPPWSLAPEATPPHAALADLTASDLRDVVDDVRGWAELDREPRSAGWWAAAGELASAALAAAEAREGGGGGGGAPPPPSRDIVTATAAAAASGAGLHPSVATDVAGLLAGKSLAALEELEAGVKATLATGEAPDPDFWACVLRALAPAKAAAWLSEAHASLVEGAARAADAAGGGFDDDGGAAPPAVPAEAAAARSPSRSPSPAPPPRPDPNADGALSPPPASDADVDAALAAGAASLTADADARLLARARAAARYAAAAALATAGGAGGAASRHIADDDADVLYAQLLAASGATAPRDATTVDDARLRAAAAAAMGDAGEAGDAPFTGDATGDAAAATYWWHARYRPRKPTYLNRVHTGYDWNRYNSAHYDTDNPPPKVVKGYKFNIFYPDLIDKSAPPRYSVERDPAAGPQAETVLLRFSAGPPYEDVVFRIVNREWEHARRHGFRCAFERGMLQLYFNFKRQRYRR